MAYISTNTNLGGGSFILDMPSAGWIMVSTNGNFQQYNVQFIIEKIEEDSWIVNQSVTNYTNPPLTSLSKITMNKLANNTYQTVNLFSNATTPQFYL